MDRPPWTVTVTVTVTVGRHSSAHLFQWQNPAKSRAKRLWGGGSGQAPLALRVDFGESMCLMVRADADVAGWRFYLPILVWNDAGQGLIFKDQRVGTSSLSLQST